jgi:hypothetical protein
MKVTSSADWRGGLEFDKPVLVADILPGDPARCSVCPYGADPWPRTQLWAVKLQHPMHHDGDVRFYCAEHLPVIEAPAPTAPREARPAARRSAPRTAAERLPRRPPVVERPRAICPNCFVEVPPSGVCGICGETVAQAG